MLSRPGDTLAIVMVFLACFRSSSKINPCTVLCRDQRQSVVVVLHARSGQRRRLAGLVLVVERSSSFISVLSRVEHVSLLACPSLSTLIKDHHDTRGLILFVPQQTGRDRATQTGDSSLHVVEHTARCCAVQSPETTIPHLPHPSKCPPLICFYHGLEQLSLTGCTRSRLHSQASSTCSRVGIIRAAFPARKDGRRLSPRGEGRRK